MTLLIVDCETTGKDPKSARLVQLAALHMESQPPWTFLRQVNCIVYPDGFTVPVEASAIHGISDERARREGRPLRAVLDDLTSLSVDAASDLYQGWLVAHNLTYDHTVLCQELDRCGLSPFALSALLPLCTMKSMTQRCNLRGKYPGKPKWPTLHEAYIHCYGQPPDESALGAAHSAMGDVLACRDIYIHGWKQEWWGR